MTILTTAQLSRLRNRPHQTRVWLSIFQPKTVLSAQINMAGIVNGERDITVTVLSGAMAAVEPGQTCYIGTTPGGHDLGRLRVRQATATKLILAENSVQWKNAWYLTVTCFHEPWGVYPRIVLDASNIPTFYKDYDILYDDQNYNMDPVICMGPNHAAFIIAGSGTSGAVNVYYTSSGTFNPTPGWEGSAATGSISSYLWSFGKGTDLGHILPTGSVLAVPGFVTYERAGHYCTKLDVVTAEGVTGTAWRHISIYNRPNEAPYHAACQMPPLKWGFDSLDGSISQGGYAARIWLREVSDWSKVVDGALVVLWTEAWEGGFQTKVGGNSPNRDSILFVGYIDDGSIRMNPESNRLEFGVSSITETLKNRGTFSAALDNVLVPASWNEMREMTVDRAVIHYLRWHSTALAVADFSQTGDVKPVHFVDFDRGAVYDTANSLLDSALVGWMVADRQGKMWCETNPSLRDTGTARGLSSILDLTRQDWMGEVGIETRPHGQTSYIEMGGLAFTGPTTGTDSAFLAGAPGEAPGYFGSLEKTSGLVVSDQEQLNRLTGHFLAKANSVYPRVDVNLAGDYRLVDLAPQARVLLTMGASENWRGLVWTSKPFLPEEVSLEYRPESQALLTRVALAEETHGDPGVTVTIPEEAPWEDNTLPEWNIDWTFPVMPPFPIMPPIEPPPGTGDLVYVTTQNRINRTRNFWAASPDWDALTPAGTGTSFYGEWSWMRQFHLDPADPLNSAYLLTRSDSAPYPSYIYHCANLNSTVPVWNLVFDPDDAAYCTFTGTKSVIGMHASPVLPGMIWVQFDANWIGYSPNYGTTWYRAGRLSPNISGNVTSVILPSYYSAAICFAGGRFYPDLWKTINVGGTWQCLTLPENGAGEIVTSFDVPYEDNPTGQWFIYASQDDFAPRNNAWVHVSRGDGTWRQEVTPAIGPTRYSCARSDATDYATKIVSWAGNRENVILVGSPVDPAGTSSPILVDSPAVLFGSTNGGLSWTPLHVFVANVGCIRWHETNVNLMYVVAGSNAGTSDSYFQGSQDGGLNWTVKALNDPGNADSYLQLNPQPASGWSLPAIHVVWTV